jgi:hypothetical protein
MNWLLPYTFSSVSKLSLFLSVAGRANDGRGAEGEGEEPNRTTARKPGPLKIIQYLFGAYCTVNVNLMLIGIIFSKSKPERLLLFCHNYIN